jgi:hypothetical protein
MIPNTHSLPPLVVRVPQWPNVYLARPVTPQAEEASAGAGEGRREELCTPLRQACKVVRQMTAELLTFTVDRVQIRRERRRQQCHARQIAMYVCHVALRIPQSDVAYAFGRDRTTVRHACAAVEDRRDSPAYDDFVGAVERLALSVFQPAEGMFHD